MTKNITRIDKFGLFDSIQHLVELPQQLNNYFEYQEIAAKFEVQVQRRLNRSQKKDRALANSKN